MCIIFYRGYVKIHTRFAYQYKVSNLANGFRKTVTIVILICRVIGLLEYNVHNVYLLLLNKTH